MSDMKTPHRIRRKKYLINTQFQLYWLVRVFMIAFAVLVSLAFSIGLYLITTPNTELTGSIEQLIFNPRWTVVPLKATLSFWILLTLLAWISFRMSHKIAGPIYRFRRVVESVTAGDYDIGPIRLRKRDEFQELADDLNKMLDALRTRREKARETAQALSQNLETLMQNRNKQESGSNTQGNQSMEGLAQLQRACSELMGLSE